MTLNLNLLSSQGLPHSPRSFVRLTTTSSVPARRSTGSEHNPGASADRFLVGIDVLVLSALCYRMVTNGLISGEWPRRGEDSAKMPGSRRMVQRKLCASRPDSGPAGLT